MRQRTVRMLERLTAKQKEYGMLGILVLGFAVLYVSLCFNNNVWTDEAFTVELLQTYHSLGEIAAYTARDVHPPLYYWILYPFVQIFGVHLLLLKVLSIVPMILTMLFGVTFVRERFGFRAGALYILMIGVLPCSMEYAVQVRMYSWALLFVTWCGVSALRAYERGRKRDWICLLLAGTAAAYTHYFAFASVLWIYGFLFLALCVRQRRKLVWWLVSVIASALLYLPWAFSLLRQIRGVSDSYWIGEITPEVVLSYFDWLFEMELPHSTGMLLIVFGIALGLTVCGLCRRQKRTDAVIALLCLLVPIGTAAAGIVASNLLRPVFIARYLLPSIGLLALFFALSMRGLDRRMYAALVVFCLFVGVLDYKKTFHQEYRATLTAQTEAFFDENLGADDIIAFNFREYDFIYAYYWDAERLVYVEDVDLGANYGNIWFLDTHFNPEFSKEQLDANGWNMTYVGNYGIEHDEFKIYKLSKQ